jgi:cytochrome oxidase assembly protein ShyY1
VLTTLRQPRYLALGALMVVVAAICIAAGTWQIHRFENKVHANDYLRTNAHDAPVAVGRLLPLVGRGSAPSQNSVEFRTVRATGTYDAAGQTLVRSRTIGDETGFMVITPLHTAGGTLLVARGFASVPPGGGVPEVPAPPPGPVTVLARAHAPENGNDHFAELTDGQIEKINPTQQAARLGGALFNGYAELEAHQPGTKGIRALPKPDLSNPAGGALEPQHFAYIVQWYLFAALALAAPLVMARAEGKRDPGEDEQYDDLADFDEPPVEQVRAAKLADRYGRAVR